MRKIITLLNATIGELIKLWCSLVPLRFLINKSNKKCTERIIVSLTSYGKRVNNTLKYTLISMLRQSLLPDRIVVWLDTDQWINKELPKYLIEMKEYGVEVKYCADQIKSYTKLIPSLREFPNDIIVTVDDDIFYSRHLIENLYTEHCKNRKNICTVIWGLPQFRHDKLMPYNDWNEYVQHDIKTSNPLAIFPKGFGGVLYPPNCFNEEVFHSEVFKKECKFADDVWFFVMGLLNGIEKSCVTGTKMTNFNVDFFRQFFHSDRLKATNVGENLNDVQLMNVMNFYKIDINKLRSNYDDK